MADFGKLNFSTSFNPTSAFPLDARCYFKSLALAEEVAATAEEVGSTNTVYYFGQKILVSENEEETWYVIKRPGVLVAEGTGSGASDNSISLLIEGVNYTANNLSDPEKSEDGEQYILHIT